MTLTPAQVKGKIKSIAAKNNADARLPEAFKATSQKRNSTFEHIGHQLENIMESTELKKLWEQYQGKYIYAADISFESALSSVKALAGKAGLY